MFSKFFIDRPIFASVTSLVITLAGLVAIPNLPVAQYPRITPPSIVVKCTYPGASAQVVAESVASPIEQQVNGVEDMLYMSSQSANDGSYSLSVTFKPGVNLNFAQVLVQNRVNLALPQLPDVVRQTGVTTRKRNPDILQIVSLYSPHGRYGQLYLSNYATIHVRDELLRVDGVGDVFNFGLLDYSMRIWVDPDRLASLNLTAGDVLAAVREQNVQVAAGHFGQPPSGGGEPFEFPITVLGRLSEPEQFGDIVLRTTDDGRTVRIRDVGRVEVGPQNQDATSQVDGHPATSLAVFQLPYANAIATAERVKEKMEELKKSFPDDVAYVIGYDTSPFMVESIWGVLHTLAEAIVLVAIVVLVFLQSWRSTLIPLAAVPVAVIGTFAAMAAIGFSLNNLTLFGLVLAIGIVVDDAIVVVEAVEHHIEHGMKPRDAAYKAMEQVSGPVVAVALVLSAVFVPCAFLSGITGQFFRQFALTIAVSTIVSAFNSLTLSPALAALLLKPRRAKRDLVGRALHFALGWFFRAFNWTFRRATAGYIRAVGLALRGSVLVLALYAGMVLLTYWGFTHLPTGYIPVQDQGKMYVAVQLPDAGSHERTQKVMDHITRILKETPGVRHITAVVGQSFTLQANGSNFANCFVTLDDFDRRRELARQHGQPMTDQAIIARVQKRMSAEVPEALIKVLGPPPVNGLGHAGGFTFILEDRSGDNDLNKLQAQAENLIATGNTPRRRLTDESLAALHAERPIPEALLPPLEELKGKSFANRKQLLHELGGALDKAGITDKAERDFVQGLVAGRAAVEGGRLRLTDESLAGVRDWRVPDEVLPGLDALKGTVFETRAALIERLGTVFVAAGLSDRAERNAVQDLVLARAGTVERATARLFTVFRANTPQLYVDVNRDQCQMMGVNPNDVFTTLHVYLGSYYVNDFNKYGRTWQVVVQAEGPFRNDPEEVKRLKVRSSSGDMVPLGAVLTVREIGGPILVYRYNMYPAAAIVGATRPGFSSGDGIESMQRLADATLPQSMGYEWTEINFIQIDASKNIWNNLIFPLAVVFVFLVLAAQYESWALPLAVILVVPMCILGSLTGVYVTHTDVNIFTQIGLVVLVGLASKNAILIVEFAKHKRESGLSRRQAALDACQLRLRPILMTSFAFILGVVPLLTASGAGSEMRHSLGLAVFAGMLGVTLFGIFLTPVFFYVIESLVETPLFSSARARQVGQVLLYGLGVLTLGLPWLLRLLLGKGRRPAPAERPVSANGAPGAHPGVEVPHGNGAPVPVSRERPASAEPSGARPARG